jgi:RNA polymerase sigma-54 factor
MQKDFLARGVTHLKPLAMEEVAMRLRVHEATVSRAAMNTYLATPVGTFPLRFFFSPGISAAHGQIAARAVRARLIGILETESTSQPMTDEELRAALRAQGITISRLTVAKYRNQLGYQPAYRRKHSPQHKAEVRHEASVGSTSLDPTTWLSLEEIIQRLKTMPGGTAE